MRSKRRKRLYCSQHKRDSDIDLTRPHSNQKKAHSGCPDCGMPKRQRKLVTRVRGTRDKSLNKDGEEAVPHMRGRCECQESGATRPRGRQKWRVGQAEHDGQKIRVWAD